MPDFDFQENASFTLVTPRNDGALAHLESHTEGTWLGGALCVEHRYAPELSASLCRTGFTVELPSGRIVSGEDLAA